MKSFWIVAVLVASCGVYATAQLDDDYDNYFNYDDLEELDKMIDEEINESSNKKTDIDNDLKVEEEIQQFREAEGEKFDAVDDPKDTVDNIDDYQFEDNRDKSKEEEKEDKKDVPIENIENRPEPDDPNAPSRNEDYALLWGDDNVAPLPVPETEEDENEPILEETNQILAENDDNSFGNDLKSLLESIDLKADEATKEEANHAIIEETKQILAEEDGNSFEEEIKNLLEQTDVKTDEAANDAIMEETKQILAEQDADNFEEEIKKQIDKNEVVDELPNIETILDETKQLLEESDSSFTDETNVEKAVETDKVDEKEKADEGNVEKKVEQVEEEDTVDKVYEDLNADLDKLFATLEKLKNDASNYSNNDDEIDKALEEADKFFEDLDNKDMEGSDELTGDNKYEELDFDKLLENILSEDDMKAENNAAEVLEPLLNDALNVPNPNDAIEKDVESLDGRLKPILYLNDALVDEPKENAETLENSEEDRNDDTKASIEEQTVKTVLVDELESSELKDLVAQFYMLHGEDLDVHSDTFDKDVAAVHMTLKLDEPTVITSPGHPGLYPTNNTIDWILEGPGDGIELNITEFAVNGALGDYLLIKPGGIDSSSQGDGLVFTYRLTAVRRYRFLDVHRLFMRFHSEPGPSSFKGFSLSVKMIAPIPLEPEPFPEPEALLSPPHSTATVTLALPLHRFNESDIRGAFREVLADMAAEYIRVNDVDPGLNTTSEVTQIVSVSLCPMTWPGFEGCTAVTFSVSLEYEDEVEEPKLDEDDLKSMWETYVDRDPFALRLRAMGITEFYGPQGAMTAWLVIAAGVIISMSMLAFVLWRYNVGGYTRMKTSSDTDSLHNEKRNLDLYPTPHQTLPPLYSDTQASEYKWPEEDTRVDMGGFANRSYTRENMYDFESDEDIIPTSDRQGVASAKDYSSNA